ncbi:MAG: OmpA family protein [Enhygromyxa sp.]
MSVHPRLSQALFIGAFTLLAACARERDARVQAYLPPGEAPGELAPGELQEAQTSRDMAVRGETPMGVESQWSVTEGDPPQWRITAIVIEVGIAELCGIDAAKAHFDYDSAQLDPDARATIAALADCFVDGPLAGREVLLIGHTDPRGPDEYNRELGMSRAEAVAQQLAREGLASTRIDVESLGEEQANTDPSEWPDNRRVDVRIAD